MIDFHSHILPGIDDGSKETSMTETMLHMEKEQGVHKIFATPHFYASEMSMEHFLKRRNHAMDKVQRRIYDNTDERLPEIELGAEVYYFPGMGKADLSVLCMGKTDLILVEMPFAQWTEDVLNDLKNIIRRQKLSIILAHVERFYKFQKDRTIWNQVFELPIIAQFNAGCLLSFTRRRLAFQFIRSGYPVIIGSDCHNATSRLPNMGDGCAIIKKKLGEQVLKDIDLRGERLLREHAIN